MNFYAVLTRDRILARALDDGFHFLIFLPFIIQFTDEFQEAGFVEIPFSILVYFFLSRLVLEVLGLYFFGTTLGKYLFKIRVQSLESSIGKLSFSQSLLRCVSYQLSFFMSWAPFVLALSRYDRTHMIDWIAKTKVVQFRESSPTKKINRIGVFLLFIILMLHGVQQSFVKMSSIDFKNKIYVLSIN